MSFLRLIARLDIKGSNVIKGIQMDGLRIVGPVGDVAKRYYEQGADEIVIIDTVASLYGRESMIAMIRNVTAECFVPVTVGGGVRTLEDADGLFRAGADKVALNTAALSRPELISEIAAKYGAQATVVHVEAKSSRDMGWECYTEAGRQPTGLAVQDWVSAAEKYGAGEFLVTSVDRDGTRKGMDIQLLETLRGIVSVPLVASSGAGVANHVVEALRASGSDGVAMGAGLHWDNFSIADVRTACKISGLSVRAVERVDV